MKHLKGAHAPFFLSLCAPRLRDDAMLTRAVDAFESGQYADALIAVEYVCRRFPTNSLPAILRAKILQACRPELSVKAWYRAWCCEPENVPLQNVMLQAWLTSGAAASVAELGPAFLPARCRNGQHGDLIAMLRRAGVRNTGACWKAGDAIEAMLFTEPEAAAPQRARLVLSDGSKQYEYEVPANGSRFRLPCPSAEGVWSLAFSTGSETAPQLLHGSPLVFKPAGDTLFPRTTTSFPRTTTSFPGTTTSFPRRREPNSVAGPQHNGVPAFAGTTAEFATAPAPGTTPSFPRRREPNSFAGPQRNEVPAFAGTTGKFATTSFTSATTADTRTTPSEMRTTTSNTYATTSDRYATTSDTRTTPSFPRRREPNSFAGPQHNEVPPIAGTTGEFATSPLIGRRAVSIIIPVYRDMALVQACIDSVLTSLPQNSTSGSILVIDDASPEPALSAWLDQLAARGRITLLRNPYNLGFIETVNRGLRHHPACDALLLNADTLVHGDWIDRLCASLHSAHDIASVTPWSNNGEISSFPKIAAATLAPTAAQLAQIDTTAARERADGKCDDVELPSCCGFTMLMRRSVIDEIGMLDGVGLIRGYGEEVDWCLRARAAGYRHLAATGVFVAHTGTVSFRFEKTLRVRQNRAVLAARYPNYHPEYHTFIQEDPLGAARAALSEALQGAGCDWLAAAVNLIEGNAERGRSLPEGLPSPCTRIAIWHSQADTPGAAKVLALARMIASEKEAMPPLRLLVIGAASDALWRTGIVDVLPSSIWQESTLLTDAAMVGLAGCRALLSEHGNGAPVGIAHTVIDDDFEPDAWLASWRALQRPQPRSPIKKRQIA
jgi:GT2 family glycosyltransferase